ncbi:hypothetical protein BDB00DRAFT_876152 [Zychaea mexicana]|uniref:uncharacterized protein n=1 Tax=Zychaea mexicana TaxID=64656 RepID=UPI0022FE24F9|nr:uncharacterized protein BDB00DRAFT_876152 [Zychaea mexicana]KAI9489603.1 hypothetical protein BDB00DRAFT_876152 [Zychaea mexicana]
MALSTLIAKVNVHQKLQKSVENKNLPMITWLVVVWNNMIAHLIAKRLWISSDMDLVDEFLKYRSDVVKEAKELELLSIVDRLALNFIYYITPSSAIRNKMDPFVWSTMVKSVKAEHRIDDISNKYVLWIMKISQAARRNIDEAKTLVRKWAVEDDSEETTLYQDILCDMFKSYSDVYDPSKFNEDTFVKDTLTPILKNYFLNDQLISTEGTNGEIIGSKERKKVFGSESECKPPRAGNSDDLFKAANCLKDYIEKSVRDGVDCNDFELYAIVSEGYRCRVLCLDLKYHGMYRLVDVGTFYIPTSINNIDTMLGVFQVMNHVRIMVLEAARLCKKTIRIKENNSQDMTLPSFDSLVRISEYNVLKMLQNDEKALDRARRKLHFKEE